MNRSTEMAVKTLLATVLRLLRQDRGDDEPMWARSLRSLLEEVDIEREEDRIFPRRAPEMWGPPEYGAALLSLHGLANASYMMLSSVSSKVDQTLKSKCPLCGKDLLATVDTQNQRLNLWCPSDCERPKQLHKWVFATVSEETRP